jgi:hypothetical protein
MITDTKINKIQAKINKAIAAIAAEENVSIAFGSISFNSAYYTTSMKVTTLEKNEKVSNVHTAICKSLGFTQNILGMTFEGKNGTMKIYDIKTRNRKYPIIAECLQDGRSYKYSKEHIKLKLGGDKIINRNANLDKLISE